MAFSNIREKVQGLISKLQTKYGVQTKQLVTQLKSFKKAKDGEDGGPKEDWFLVDEKTKRFCLPKTMLFLGRDECDVVVQSQSVDKRHAVVTYDHYLSRFKIKDLSTANGTYVNESRIPEQEYVTLNHMDSVRLGYDTMLYHVEQGDSIPQHQCHLPHSDHLPGWANRSPPVIDMAECEGCIAEQQIHHTCAHQTEPNFVDMHRSFGKKDVEDESKHGLGSNTWPRKRLRQVRHHAHVASVFSDDGHTCDMDQPDDGMTNNGYCYHPGSDGPHHPTCEHSMYGEKDHGHPCVPTCKCYAKSNADYLDYAVASQANGVTRIPRSGSKHALHPELETVKKGTPLYGQPDWWGEEDDTESYPSKSGSKRSSLYGDSDDKSSVQVDRPRSLSLEQKEALSRMEKSQGDPEYGIRYMEIPAHRIVEQEREKETPPRSMSSSISKDSLFSDASKMNTPDTPGDKSSKEGTPDRRAVVEPMAFTIDFGDDDKKDKMPKSLSECMPSKIRKSFRERKEKAKQNKEATPNKSEEEREVSPAVQKKQDDAGSSTSDTKPTKKPLSSKRTSTDNSVQKKPSGEKSPPTKLSDNGESAGKTDTFTKSSRSARSKKSPSSVRSTNKSPKTKSTEVSSIDPTQYKNPTSYLIDKMFEGSDNGNGNSSSNGSGKSSSKISNKMNQKVTSAADRSHVPLTEHDLYRESMDYDTGVHNGDSNGDICSASNLKSKKSKEMDKLVTKDKKEDDKVSEAGTYTIEADEDCQEEEEARKNIDRVFGVEDNVSFNRPVIDVDSSEQESEEREITESADLALKRSFRERGSSMEVEAGSADTMEDLDIPDDIDLEELSLATMSTTDVPKWVSQWAALAKQKALKKSQSLDLEEGHNNQKDSSSQKPPNGRKRPGTGRKLPSIPTDRSPCSSDYSANVGEVSPRSGDVTPRQEDQSDFWPVDSPTKPKSVTISSQVVTHYQETNGDSSGRGRSESGSDMNGGDSRRSGSPEVNSSRTSTTMDTEVLLRDTEDVMAAMEARMASRAVENKKSAVNGYGQDDEFEDSDSDSMVAVVNGDDKFVKPTTFSSPRESLAKRSANKSVVTSTPKKPPLGKSLSVRDQNVTKPSKNRSYSLDNSTVSDIYSESSELGDSESYRSDVSSDNVVSSRKKEVKKGLITNTKPNRAFALRRAKADAPEESPRTSRSTGSTPSTTRGASNRTASSSRAPTASSSARSTARSKSGMSGRYDSGKSEASLGAEIVKKSRENIKASPDANFDRKDGGRHSLRSSYKTNSQKTLSVFNPTEAARRTELKNLKTQLRKSEGSRGLSVTGHSARSQSQPGSRSNSPKAAERMAWKRRKEYDPRKAVATAKAKAKDTPRQKPLSASQSSLAFTKQKMFRSASFTNSAELSGRSSDSYRNGSVSSAEDLSLTMSEAMDSFDERGLRRAFIPLSGPLRSDRISHSADEDDSSLSITSSQSYDTLLITSIYQLSLKLKTATDRTLNKLRDNNRVSATPSPIDDFMSHTAKSEIPAWKSANQELAGILKNLRKIEHHQQVMERALFPDEDSPTEVSRISSREKQKYFQEIQRIRNELQGFHFIDKPECEEGWKKQENTEEMSPDMEEIGEEEFY